MVELKSFVSHTPDVGKKIVAFFDDGSGADLYYRHEDGTYIDAEAIEGYSTSLTGLGYSTWDYLPDDFIFAVEDSSNVEA